MKSTLPVLDTPCKPRTTWVDELVERGIDRDAVWRRVPEARKASTADLGFSSLFTIDRDPKTRKSNKKGVYRTAIMYLLPGKVVCPDASPGCLKGCLNTAGIPYQLKGKLRARRGRVELLRTDPELFMARLLVELQRLMRQCRRLGVKPAVRLNGTSDIPWEKIVPWLFSEWRDVQFYDYTKTLDRVWSVPANYWLTLSRSETNDAEVRNALLAGYTVAVVVDKEAYKEMPESWGIYDTCDGDADDLIFLREKPVQLLKAKGKARTDDTGFVLGLGDFR